MRASNAAATASNFAKTVKEKGAAKQPESVAGRAQQRLADFKAGLFDAIEASSSGDEDSSDNSSSVKEDSDNSLDESTKIVKKAEIKSETL